MARPTKQGVDYFPLDVYLDDKFKFIEIKYKLEGFAILIKLLQKIYSCGFWYKWTEDEILIFADENRTETELVKNIVSEALERDIFDKGLYERYNILTSRGIQKRYKEIVKRRKDVIMQTEYLLIDNINEVNVNIMSTSCEQDVCKSTQSKVKESKVNKTKVNKTKVKETKVKETKIKDKFITCQHLSMTEEEYRKLVNLYGESAVKDKLDYAVNYKGLKNFVSLYLTLNNWLRKNKQEKDSYYADMKR